MDIATSPSSRNRWWAFGALCLGYLMMIVDGTAMNVALPSIRADLGFTPASLVWVLNAYLLPYASFLLLGGRLGDLFGHSRLFLAGMTLFTVASLGCGLAKSQEVLIGARAMQGVGGAIVTATSLSLTMSLFSDVSERASALGIAAFVSIGAQGAGIFFAGILTSMLNWHWIFLANVPIGIAVYPLGRAWLPDIRNGATGGYVDIVGAITGATALMVATYTIVNVSESGWLSVRTEASFGATCALLILFYFVENRVPAPIMPFGFFRRRNLLLATLAGALWSASVLTWYFTSTLYMQLVLGYTALQASLAFFPVTLLTAIISIGRGAKFVLRFGFKPPLTVGLLLAAGGLICLAGSRAAGTLTVDLLPGMFLLGVGGGMVSSPLLLAAMAELPPGELGAGSGVISTSSTIGGALGLTLLTGIASARTHKLLASGVASPIALTRGYHVAFLLGAAFAIVAAVVAALLRPHEVNPSA